MMLDLRQCTVLVIVSALSGSRPLVPVTVVIWGVAHLIHDTFSLWMNCS